MDLRSLNGLLEFSMVLRRRHRLLTFPALRALLARIQDGLSAVLGCRVAYGGSLSLFLQGITAGFGDIDVITDREWMPEDLPWRVDWRSQIGSKIERYDLDLMFNAGQGELMALANRHIVTVDGLRLQDADFIKAINRLWDDPDKARVCADWIEPDLLSELRRCL